MSWKFDGEQIVCAVPFCGSDLLVLQADSRYALGSGGRGLRHWMRQLPCCEDAYLGRLPDGRWQCGTCKCWYSASHSNSVLALTRSHDRIGVDVQFPCHRPAAMRWLAAVSGLQNATITHWAAAEAMLKASGRAGVRPQPGWAVLPEMFGAENEVQMGDGTTGEVVVTTVQGAILAVCRLCETVGASCPK